MPGRNALCLKSRNRTGKVVYPMSLNRLNQFEARRANEKPADRFVNVVLPDGFIKAGHPS